MKIAAIVGMTGSGKSEAAAEFEKNGFVRIRFGDITDEEVKKRGLPLTEENERKVREALRREHGMAAYAVLNKPKIDDALEKSDVVVDGLYSWEEYIYLKESYGDRLVVVAVWASPEVRYARLSKREKRGLTREQAASRDKAEIENVNKGGPIAMADITILNEFSLDATREVLAQIIAGLKNG
jgi:dephospho-CoA kinase